MKKYLLLLLSLCLFLSGCGKLSQSSVVGTLPSEGGDFTFPQQNFEMYVNLSDSGVWDLRPFMDTRLSFMVLTNSPLEDSTSVGFQFTGACEYQRTACENETMPFWLYQTYRGVDWTEVAQLSDAAKAGNVDSAKQLEMLETLYLSDYETLTPADLPQIYGYWITNDITTANSSNTGMAAQYTTLPLTVGTEEMLVDVGLLNVHGQGWDQILPKEAGITDRYMGRLTDVIGSYWGDGQVTLPTITVKADTIPQTLTALQLYGLEAEILNIHVTIGGESVQWDGASLLEIPANTTASITVILQTMLNQQVGYCEDANLVLYRETEEKQERLWYFASISQSWNIYELYAMMVDGLDIASYYAYSAQWEQPERVLLPQGDTIEFDTVMVAQTPDYSLSVTGVSWDNHAYSLHISAANYTEDRMDLVLGKLYVNQYDVDKEYRLSLIPGEQGDYTWRIAWETLADYGIFTTDGRDIHTVEFVFNAMPGGEVPKDSYGNPIVNNTYTCISPTGESSEEISIDGIFLLETEQFRLYAMRFDSQCVSSLNELSRQPGCAIAFLIENRMDRNFSYITLDYFIDGIRLDGMDADVVRSASRSFSIVNLQSHNLLENPESLSFTLMVNNQTTYTVTVNLTQFWEG